MPTEILGLDVLVAGQPQKEVTVNTALRQIEGRLVRALSRTTTTPPTTPAEGAGYIVAASATGAWAGQDNKIAHFFGGAWKFWQPIEGIRLWVNDEDLVYAFDGSAWVIPAAGALSNGDRGDIVVSAAGATWTIDPAVLSTFGRTLTDDADAAAARATLGLGTVAVLASDTSLTANSDLKVATQKAVKTYVDAIATSGATDVMIFKGVIDCSANPNYPAADAGNLYKVSVAGKIGGASGADVGVGDTLYCITDGTAAGTQAAVGASWNIAEGNETTATAGALINSATSKTTPVDADYIGLMDSAASNVLKKLSWANIKAVLKTYFDTLYAPLSQPFDIHTFYPGVPTASAKLYRGKLARAVTFAGNFSGAQFTASANATASTVFDIQKNGTSVGTCTIAAGTATPTFVSASGAAVSYSAGDIFAVIGPLTADATLADPAITFAGTR